MLTFYICNLTLLFKLFDSFTGECICSHEDFLKLLDPFVLQVNLKIIWSCGVYETETKEASNNNLRYSAYRSLHAWLDNNKKIGGRKALPSCIVSYVKLKYPDPDGQYTGFVPSSPVFKRKTRKNL